MYVGLFDFLEVSDTIFDFFFFILMFYDLNVPTYLYLSSVIIFSAMSSVLLISFNK